MTEVPNVRIESPALSGIAAQISEVDGVEAIGKLFEFRIELVCPVGEAIDEEMLFSAPAALIFSRHGEQKRRIFGKISAVKDRLHSEGAHLLYTLSFVPRVFTMTLNKTSRVFVDMSVPEIVTKKLDDAGFMMGDDFELRLISEYPKRELVMQYEETDFHFISRLVEHLGISMFFEHREPHERLIFSDDNSAFAPIDGEATVPFNRRGDETGVFAFEGTTRAIPAKYVLKDYNYRTPKVDLVAEIEVSDAGTGSVVEYGAHFKTKEEGDQMALVRAEELRAMRRVFDGKSDIQTFRAGAKLKLDGHPKWTEELLLLEVRHRASQVVFGSGKGTERTYTNEFRAIPASATFRPPRQTQKPRVHGAISGVIEAMDSYKYAELDDQGRYHVRFMLDQSDAPRGSASSWIRMAQPHAGPGYGFHFPLRDGVEVMLTCIDGDPDRPIITGAVPNPTTPSPVASKNATRNVIRTGGGTEMNIDDEASGTRFKVSTPHENTVFQLGAPNAPVAGIFMGTDKDAVMKIGETLKVDSGKKIDLIAGESLKASAPAIDVIGGKTVGIEAPTVNVKAKDNLNEEAPSIDVFGTKKVQISSPKVEVIGKLINASGQRIMLTGLSALRATSKAIIIVHGNGPVTISSGEMVKVKAPKVVVDGKSEVNVTGGVIKLNA